MPVWLSLHSGGVVLALYVQPRASKTAIVGIHDGMVKVACSSPPVDGKANKELVTFLARCLKCRKAEVELIRGHNGRRKQFLLHGITVPEVSGLLEGI